MTTHLPYARLSLWLLVLIPALPFFNFARYAPLPDWWTHATALGLTALALLATLPLPARDEQRWQLPLPAMLPWLLAWWCAVFLPLLLLRGGSLYQLPLAEASAVLVAALAACLLHRLQATLGRDSVLTALATALLLAALLQALIGACQLFGLAPLACDYLVFDAANPASNIMGNVAQRNQFAQLLTWGLLAAAYLWVRGRLARPLALLAMLLLSLVISWSGGRLPLAYGVAMLAVAALWWWRRRGANRTLALALGSAALLLLLMQLLGGAIGAWLSGNEVLSGLDRLGDAGFGARRRIEWQKAWQIVQAYPWLGVGLGGFAYQSTWLETFAGLAKVPESTLFTHSHNLIAQLLAETGVPATLLAAAAVSACLLPYLKREHASADNAFLLLWAATMLGHSLFEYPLWYLPFLCAFCMALALSPLPARTLAIRVSLRRAGSVLALLLVAGYLWHGVGAFQTLTRQQYPTPDMAENRVRIVKLLALARHPLWAYDAELALGNFLLPSRQDVALKRAHFEQLVAYRPYPMLLVRLAMLRAWQQDAVGAHDAMSMALASYPDLLPQFLLQLAPFADAPLQPLRRMTLDAQLVATDAHQRALHAGKTPAQADGAARLAVARHVTAALPRRAPLRPSPAMAQ